MAGASPPASDDEDETGVESHMQGAASQVPDAVRFRPSSRVAKPQFAYLPEIGRRRCCVVSDKGDYTLYQVLPDLDRRKIELDGFLPKSRPELQDDKSKSGP